MINNYISTPWLLSMGVVKGFKSVYILNYLHVLGKKNHISNVYVMYIYDLSTDKVLSFITLYHTPRGNDVIKLLEKISKDNTDQVMLITQTKNPFFSDKIQRVLKENFGETMSIKSKFLLGRELLFYNYLRKSLSLYMAQYKNNLQDVYCEDGKVSFNYPEENVNYLLYSWNKNNYEIIELLLDENKEQKECENKLNNLNSLNLEEIYYFETQIVKVNKIELRLNLIPLGICSANVKLLNSLYFILNTQLEIVELEDPKVILVSCHSNGSIFTLRNSFVFTQKTTLEEFVDAFAPAVTNLINKAYPLDSLELVNLRIFQPKDTSSTSVSKTSIKNVSSKVIKGIRNFSTHRPKEITPLTSTIVVTKKIGVLDIETVVVNSVHIPYAIGYQLTNLQPKLFYVSDYGKSLKPASNKIMKACLNSLLTEAKDYNIYIHNLGSFDGYLLLNPLTNINDKIKENLNIMVDQQKQFIAIDIKKHNIRLRDSLRILPTGLKNLSNLFDVNVKKGHLDHENVDKNKVYNDDFKTECLEYLKKDLVSLFDVMIEATNWILKEYNVDLTKSYSASSLAIRIYRTNYLDTPIPMLPHHMDKIIRSSYRGGATEVYKCYGENLYYYDVNSLYPYAILNEMPFEFITTVKNPSLDNFFGFIKANIYAPTTIFNPFLPYKDSQIMSIVYPYGHFSGTYFSEELKIAASKGYLIDPIIGYKFSKKNLFKEYVEHFYEKKANSTGSSRFLYKLFLNSIYGYLGRKPEMLKTEIISHEKINQMLQLYPIHNVVWLNDKSVLIVRETTPFSTLNIKDKLKIKPSLENPAIINNVAIASAITSYARITIIPFRTDVNNPPFYTDTDSIFLQYPLNHSLIGNAIGLVKDELKGSYITEALFLAPKKYGFKTPDSEKVVIAGVPPNTITFEELKRIWEGEKLTKQRTVFVKNFEDLSIRENKLSLELKALDEQSSKTPVFDNKNRLQYYSPKYYDHPTHL